MTENENKIITGLKINPSTFRLLCENVHNCLVEIDQSMFEWIELKDKLLLQYLPRTVALNITLIFSRFYRAYSQSQIPISELLRLVQLYIEPFDMKCEVFKRLYESNEMNKRLLHLALNKLTSADQQSQLYEEQRILSHWEKMYIRSVTTRGNIRLWKFRIKTFREKANLGYEQVMLWIRTGIVRSVGDTRTASTEEVLEIKEEIDRENSSIEQVDHFCSSSCVKITHDDENVVEESETVDVDVQVQPDYDHQQTSTEDAVSTRSLILRIYRPIGIDRTKFQSIVHVHQRTYPTKIFLYHKSPVRTVTNNRMTRSSKRTDMNSEKDDVNTIDIHQADELIIPLDNVLTRRSLFETDLDPDALKIEIYANEKLHGSLIFSSEDLQMLDLPTLHNPIFSPFLTFEDNPPSEHVLRFDQPSNQLYQLWITRRPPTYSIYDQHNQVIGRLPLWMFWYEKSENKFVTKGIMTEPMEIPLPTPRMEIFISSTPKENLDEISSEDQLEIIKASYENEISRLHEAYQLEIHRLTTLIHEASSAQSRYNSNVSTEKRQANKRPFTSSVHQKDLPKPFLDRYEMYLERSILHRHQLSAKIERETALANERQMEIQHRLHKPEHDVQFDEDDLCLPAVFMPFQSGQVFNPRAYQYFHPTGSSACRLTQAPSIPKFPSLPHRSYSVLNLFELSRMYENGHSTARKDPVRND